MHKLFDHKPSFEAVEKVVNQFPSTLSHAGDHRLSIHTTAASVDAPSALEYVPPVLVKVGGEDARGGLLKIDPYEIHWNV